MKRIKTLRGYQAHYRFLDEIRESRSRYFARYHAPVSTPYLYSPTGTAYEHSRGWVWVAETAHRRFEVWTVPESILRQTDEEAEQEQLTHNKQNP